MQLSKTMWLWEGCQGTIKLLPSQKKLVCVYNQGDTRLQPKERINVQVCDLHQIKQEKEGPDQIAHGHFQVLTRAHLAQTPVSKSSWCQVLRAVASSLVESVDHHQFPTVPPDALVLMVLSSRLI